MRMTRGFLFRSGVGVSFEACRLCEVETGFERGGFCGSTVLVRVALLRLTPGIDLKKKVQNNKGVFRDIRLL